MSEEPASRHWTSQGLNLHYLDWGHSDAPILLTLHGSGDHARSWDWTARALRNDYRVIAPDLRGHGDSAWSPDGAYTTPYHLQDIADLIDQRGAGRVSIIGHSFGGVLALRYAALFPERVDKLIVIDGMGPAPEWIAKHNGDEAAKRARSWIEQRREAVSASPRAFAAINDVVARLKKENPRLPDAHAQHLATHAVRKTESGYALKRDPLARLTSFEDFALDHAALWRHVAAPTLLFYAPESWKPDPAADGRAAALQNWRSITIANAGHWLHHDQFDDFITAVREFL